MMCETVLGTSPTVRDASQDLSHMHARPLILFSRWNIFQTLTILGTSKLKHTEQLCFRRVCLFRPQEGSKKGSREHLQAPAAC